MCCTYLVALLVTSELVAWALAALGLLPHKRWPRAYKGVGIITADAACMHVPGCAALWRRS